MDVLTQGLLGAALSQSIANKKETRLATGVGFFAGLIADLDILISSSSDPMLNIEIHRHFTHSIFFVPIGGLIAALVLWPVLKLFFKSVSISFKRLYVFCLLGYSLSGFIDACTSYGTHLLWPLYDERISFHIISIIDPVFTGVLLFAVIKAWRDRRPRLAHYGLLFCGLYLLLGALQLHRANDMAMELAQSRRHEVEKISVKPSLANLLLWRSIYISGDKIYVDAVRPGITASKTYIGDSVDLFIPERDATGIPRDSVLYADILRFQEFSDGFIALEPGKENLLGDVRYSMTPIKIATLWGITLDKDKPDEHAHYGFYRATSPGDREKFFQMLLGK
ncbi:MAG: metal-dependent hydrolase [Gammaproteobacteria bacterium]|nr:metal-dependent hydrolase [Gammaproteobacteria bacterium]